MTGDVVDIVAGEARPDAAWALAATGYNFRRLIRWLRFSSRKILTALFGRLSLFPG